MSAQAPNTMPLNKTGPDLKFLLPSSLRKYILPFLQGKAQTLTLCSLFHLAGLLFLHVRLRACTHYTHPISRDNNRKSPGSRQLHLLHNSSQYSTEYKMLNTFLLLKSKYSLNPFIVLISIMFKMKKFSKFTNSIDRIILY